MLYRIYIEDINRERICDLVQGYADSYTLIPVIGIWNGQEEKSLIIELGRDSFISHGTLKELADSLRVLCSQRCVLVTLVSGESVVYSSKENS
jgi:hypothetical protein